MTISVTKSPAFETLRETINATPLTNIEAIQTAYATALPNLSLPEGQLAQLSTVVFNPERSLSERVATFLSSYESLSGRLFTDYTSLSEEERRLAVQQFKESSAVFNILNPLLEKVDPQARKEAQENAALTIEKIQHLQKKGNFQPFITSSLSHLSTLKETVASKVKAVRAEVLSPGMQKLFAIHGRGLAFLAACGIGSYFPSGVTGVSAGAALLAIKSATTLGELAQQIPQAAVELKKRASQVTHFISPRIPSLSLGNALLALEVLCNFGENLKNMAPLAAFALGSLISTQSNQMQALLVPTCATAAALVQKRKVVAAAVNEAATIALETVSRYRIPALLVAAGGAGYAASKNLGSTAGLLLTSVAVLTEMGIQKKEQVVAGIKTIWTVVKNNPFLAITLPITFGGFIANRKALIGY